MDGAWLVSHIALWVLQLVTIVFVAALARQVGVLHLRLPPLGPGTRDDGPVIGRRLDLAGFEATTLLSRRVPVLDPERPTIYVVANATCSVCEPVLRGLSALMAVERNVRYEVAIDVEDGQPLEYVRSYGFGDAVPTRDLPFIQVTTRPFAIALGPEGTVLAAGVVNSLEQLEELQALAFRVAADVGIITPDTMVNGLDLVEIEPLSERETRTPDQLEEETNAQRIG